MPAMYYFGSSTMDQNPSQVLSQPQDAATIPFPSPSPNSAPTSTSVPIPGPEQHLWQPQLQQQPQQSHSQLGSHTPPGRLIIPPTTPPSPNRARLGQRTIPGDMNRDVSSSETAHARLSRLRELRGQGQQARRGPPPTPAYQPNWASRFRAEMKMGLRIRTSLTQRRKRTGCFSGNGKGDEEDDGTVKSGRRRKREASNPDPEPSKFFRMSDRRDDGSGGGGGGGGGA
ncbi:hypothetical protein K458DRAFT_401500 [Lentithecium fluviatile CBS 122367]|uniref:Uncharacterized protein n=1 Tax=Lentithecium fluviatile CBS 122367 TaxID=1168545 RepID=A0A6G1JCF3_9PLEO|nr:hypothetical protein K458DRAFT_401500 [Lentithecium fluviatile CBS 122367]